MWKHTLTGAQAIEHYLRHDPVLHQPLNETVLVAMVRSPLSNLVSLKKAPYNMDRCFSGRPWSKYDRPCFGTVKLLDPGDAFMPGLSTRTWFNSSMDVYNRYLQQYLDLEADKSFKKVLIVNYEDLVLDPEEVMRAFAEAAGVEPPRSTTIVDLPAKNHGHPVGREYALIKIKHRTYMEMFEGNSRVIKKVCSGFALHLVKNRIEGSYRDLAEQRPYAADCISHGFSTTAKILIFTLLGMALLGCTFCTNKV